MMKRESLFHLFFLLAFGALLVEFVRIIYPFLTPLFLALVLWMVALPLDRYFQRRLSRWGAGARAILSTFSVLGIFVVPIVLLVSLFVHEFKGLLPQVQQTVLAAKTWAQNPTWDQWPLLQKIFSIYDRYPDLPRVDLNDKISELANAGLILVTNAGGALAASTATLVFYLFMVLFTLYFLFRDGRHWYATLIELVPMHADLKKRIARTIRVTVADVVRGSVITSLIQTLIAIVGYWIVGLPAAITMGLATGTASFIPVVGSGLVWVPVAIYLLLKGAIWKFVFLTIWGIVAISMSDNVIRTFFIGQSIETPVFLMFLSLIGGVLLYGAMGLLIGPLIVAVLPLFMEIYREMFLRDDPF